MSGGCDSLVKIWRQGEDGHWTEEAKLEAHYDWVRDTAWAPSLGSARQTIASCGQDRRVVIWTQREGGSWVPKILHTFEDVVWHVSWSVSGNILAVSGGDNKVRLALRCDKRLILSYLSSSGLTVEGKSGRAMALHL